MGKVIFTALVLFISWYAQAQDGIGIGTTSPHSSAILDVYSNNKGLLLPRVDALPDNAEDGLVLYNNEAKSLYGRENGQWYSLMPRGTVLMWYGNPSLAFNNGLGRAEYGLEGWALCDGTVDGVPNLNGKFIVGYDKNSGSNPTAADKEENYGKVGNTGGKVDHTLSTTEMPGHTHGVIGTTASNGSHTHSIIDPGHDHNIRTYDGGTGDQIKRGDKNNPTSSKKTEVGYTGITVASNGSHTHTFSTTSNTTGGGASHENRPPYYVLAFIMKL